jgi:sec-independent protein translocase protein TatA
MVPLQMGIPGGPELVVILLVLLLLFGIPLVLLGVGGFAYLRANADDDTKERIAELEGEIDQLKADLDAVDQSTDDGPTIGDESTAGDGNDGSADDPQAGA